MIITEEGTGVEAKTGVLDLNPSEAMPTRRGDRLLLEELTYRASEEFAAAVGITAAAIATASSDQVRKPLLYIQRALESFITVHHLLQVPRLRTRIDAHAYLRVLCDEIRVSKLEYRGVQLDYLEQPPLRLDSEQCWRTGLIVAELITWAAQPAHYSPCRRICVELCGAGFGIQCTVRAEGAGTARSLPAPRLGIVAALAEELMGRLIWESRTDTTACTLLFPSA